MTDFAAIDLETANGQRSSVCIDSVLPPYLLHTLSVILRGGHGEG